MKNYIQNLRKKIGQEKFIHPAARIIVENEEGEILFIERIDNGKLGIPAGGLEDDETIEACIIREVKEETGLEILSLKVIGISSDPQKETVEYPNGDVIQYFTIEFYSNHWKGTIKADEVEVKHAKFMSPDHWKVLPRNEQSIFESLFYYQKNKAIRLT